MLVQQICPCSQVISLIKLLQSSLPSCKQDLSLSMAASTLEIWSGVVKSANTFVV